MMVFESNPIDGALVVGDAFKLAGIYRNFQKAEMTFRAAESALKDALENYCEGNLMQRRALA